MANRRMLGRSQIDASDVLHEYSCSPCSEDGKNTEALYHCRICQAFYCRRCVDFHNKFSKNHNITDKTSDTFGQKVIKSAAHTSNALPTDVCEEHHEEVVKMFCGHHDLVCCSICIAMKHGSCEGVEYIPNIARGFLKSLEKEDTKTSLQTVKADLETLKSRVENDLKRIDEQRDRIIDDIQEFKKRIIARLEELERKSLNDANSKRKEMADNLNACNKKIDGLLKVIDTRLHKLAKDGNDAQTFVEMKNIEKVLSEGTHLAKQTTFNLRDAEAMQFKENTDIEEYLSKIQCLGSLKEYIGSVNIVCPVVTRVTCAFISELQSQLNSFDIHSMCTEASEVVAGRYTIVICAPGYVRAAITSAKGIKDDTIILVRLLDYHSWHSDFRIQRNVKADFMISYTESRGDKNIAFADESNKKNYEYISKIVMGHK